MSGPRYEDWHHLRVEGDKDAARALIPLARKVLGYAVQEAGRNGLMTYKHTHTLPNGKIVGEVVGGIPRVTISVEPVGGVGARRLMHGFHLTWTGDSTNYTPIIFHRTAGEEGEDDFRDWKVSFYNSDAIGYEEVPEERRGGSYRDTFGKLSLEAGYRMYGNAIWYHPDHKEVVSWIRGYPAYWPQHFRHPRTLYSNTVSIFGHVCFVPPNPEWRVMAAAKRGKWLYVMMGLNLGVMDPELPSGPPTYSGQVWFSQPYTDEPYNYALWRFPLVVQPLRDTGVESYVANTSGGEQLWTDTLELAYGAWSFNRDCTLCVAMQLPRKAVWKQPNVIEGINWVPSDENSDAIYPKVEAERMELAIEHEGDEATVTFSSEVDRHLIAEEDGVRLEIHETAIEEGFAQIVYRLDGFDIPVVEETITGLSGGTQHMDRRLMIHAHLPTRTLLLQRWCVDLEPFRFLVTGYELYRAGERVPMLDESSEETTFPSSIRDLADSLNYTRRMSINYDDGVGTSWSRPLDAMTFLMGFTFVNPGTGLVSRDIPPPPITGEPGYGYQTVPHIPFWWGGVIPDNGVPHTGAGGYIFGSIRGDVGDQFWGYDFTYAVPYGANAGYFLDPDPQSFPVASSLVQAVTFADHTLVASTSQPSLAILIGGAPSGLDDLALKPRRIYSGSYGDPQSLMTAIKDATFSGFTLGHTGMPRMAQRGEF